jgi:hypothetical protein
MLLYIKKKLAYNKVLQEAAQMHLKCQLAKILAQFLIEGQDGVLIVLFPFLSIIIAQFLLQINDELITCSCIIPYVNLLLYCLLDASFDLLDPETLQ